MEALNTISVTPKELAQALTKAIKAKVPVLVTGSPGVGKSSIVAQVSKSLTRRFIDIRLPYMDPVDLHGLPLINGTDMEFARPKILPNDPDEQGVILFDEITACGESMQAAAYQLILEGRVGEHVIQGDWARIGAGNLLSDNAIAHKMSSALANRFMHLVLRPDADQWIEWAIGAGLSPFVIGYIKQFPNSLFEEPGNLQMFCTPRSWERVSDLIKEDTFAIGRELEMKMIAGCIGPGEGAAFVTFYRKLQFLPLPSDIIAKPSTTEVPVDAAAQFAITIALGQMADATNIGKIITYVNRLEPEMRVLFGSAVTLNDTRNKIKPYNCEPYRKFTDQLFKDGYIRVEGQK